MKITLIIDIINPDNRFPGSSACPTAGGLAERLPALSADRQATGRGGGIWRINRRYGLYISYVVFETKDFILG